MKYILISLCLLFGISQTHGQCYKDRHNTSSSEAWTSCVPKLNPNNSRGLSHWIMYDFGQVYRLGQSHFWNVNAPGKTGSGIKTAIIDYSFDGVTWEEWGTFSLEEADASGFYEGEDGPDFEDLKARYILITSIDNHGHLCTGLSEIRIETSGVVTSVSDEEIVLDDINIFPNPSSDLVYVQFKLDKGISAELRITDINGKIVLTKDVFMSAGTNQIPVDVSQYPSGQYVAGIVNESFVRNKAFTVFRDK
ncbi:MAG: T9SS type A sorting domain-containing protein [Bacteroidia bacterium]|nr:T9SS type A sorting domain-containing protein [Bacteroidia bacterium]